MSLEILATPMRCFDVLAVQSNQVHYRFISHKSHRFFNTLKQLHSSLCPCFSTWFSYRNIHTDICLVHTFILKHWELFIFFFFKWMSFVWKDCIIVVLKVFLSLIRCNDFTQYIDRIEFHALLFVLIYDINS